MAPNQPNQSEELLHVRFDSNGRSIRSETLFTMSLRTIYLDYQAFWEEWCSGFITALIVPLPVTTSNEMIRFFLYAFYRKSAEIE